MLEGFACLFAGVIVGAITERVCRRLHPHARVRNIIIKVAVAYAAVSAMTGEGVPSSHGEEIQNIMGLWKILYYLTMRTFTFVWGTIVGAALQPVGLTGGIATGKSTVSTLLSNNNAASGIDEKAEFVIIDLDKIAHDILLPKELVQNDSVYDRLVSEFGTDILLSTNEGGNSNNCSIPTIDRRKLGDLVFADRQKRRKLNSITHPKIISIMLKRIFIEGLRLSKPKCEAASCMRRYSTPIRGRIAHATIVRECHCGSLQLDVTIGKTSTTQSRPDLGEMPTAY